MNEDFDEKPPLEEMSPRSIFNNELIQGEIDRNKSAFSKTPQQPASPGSANSPTYQKARRLVMNKRSPYSNALPVVSSPGAKPQSKSRMSPSPSLNYSDHRRRVDLVKQLSPTGSSKRLAGSGNSRKVILNNSSSSAHGIHTQPSGAIAIQGDVNMSGYGNVTPSN